jgi:hypothetical protein
MELLLHTDRALSIMEAMGGDTTMHRLYVVTGSRHLI